MQTKKLSKSEASKLRQNLSLLREAQAAYGQHCLTMKQLALAQEKEGLILQEAVQKAMTSLQELGRALAVKHNILDDSNPPWSLDVSGGFFVRDLE